MEKIKSNKCKKFLNDIIDNVCENSNKFVKNPESDFKRNRKLNLKTVLNLMLHMEGNTLDNEIFKYFKYKSETPSSSAFIQQRNKINLNAFQFLYTKFTQGLKCNKKYKGYKLLACDGSNLNIYRNPKDKTTFIHNKVKGYNRLHLNTLYDVLNGVYIDAIIQNGKEANERKAFNTMIDRLDNKEDFIIIADRGYAGFNSYAHVIEANQKFLIRDKDINSNGVFNSMKFPDTEFDITKTLVLGKHSYSNTKIQSYRQIRSRTAFDYITDENPYYTITLRFVRFKLANGNYECIITNLDKNEFTVTEIKELYHLRWGIETSFRELKYDIGITNFHSKRKDFVLQEIYIRLTLYNFCSYITRHTEPKNKKGTTHIYQINHTKAFNICKQYLIGIINFTIAIKHISKSLLPVRKGRTDIRNLKQKQFVSFLYRVA